MASGFNFYPFLLIRLYLLESVRVCTLLKTVHSTPGKSDKTHKKSDNWVKIELFSVLSVFFFSSYFLFRNHFCPFFCLFFTRLSSNNISFLSTRGALSMVNLSKRFQTTPLCPRKKLDHMNIYTYKKFQVNLLLSRTYNSCPLKYIQYQCSSCLVSTCTNLIFDGVVTEQRCSEMNITWLNWSRFKCRVPKKITNQAVSNAIDQFVENHGPTSCRRQDRSKYGK